MGIFDQIFRRRPSFEPKRLAPATSDALHVLSGHRGHVTSVGFVAGDNVLLTGDTEGNVAGWRTPSFEKHLAVSHKPPGSVYSLAGGLSGGAYFGIGPTVKMWKTGQNFLENGKAFQSFTLKGHAREVTAVVRTAAELVSGACDGRFAFWDETTGKTTLVGQLESPILSFGCTLHSLYDTTADGQLAMGHEDGSVTVMNLDGHDIARGWKAHSKDVYALAFQNFRFQQRHLLATVSPSDRAVRIWDKVNKVMEFEAATYTVCFSPDGRLLAHGDNHDIVIRDGRTWSVLQRLRGHRDFIGTLAFSPMQHQDDLWSGWLASGSHDGTARVWNVDA